MGHLWFVLRWLHLIAMAFFVGGQLFLAAIVVPAVRANSAPARLGVGDPTLRAVARRFGVGTLIALALLIATGVPMAFHDSLWGDHVFDAKLGLVVLIGLLIGAHMRRPRWHALEGLTFVASLAVVWIGLYLANGWS